MKLRNVLSKLKQSTLKRVDFENCDLERAGDFLLALALAATVTIATVVPFYMASHGGPTVHF